MKTVFAVLSDIHIIMPEKLSKCAGEFSTALDDLLSLPDVDALILLGDITNNGWLFQFHAATQILKKKQKYQVAIYILLGNHDIFHYFPRRSSILKLKQKLEEKSYCVKCFGLYESHTVKHTSFLILNSEKRERTSAYFSRNQITGLNHWLKDKDQMVFIFNHQPLTNTHPGSDSLGLGDQDEDIKKILKKYKNAIWVSGHIHNSVKEAHMIQNAYGIQIDIPSFQQCQQKEGRNGCGCIVIIDDNEVVVKTRDCLQHVWLKSEIWKNNKN